MINFKPKTKHFLVRLKEKTEKGIYLPESAITNILDSLQNKPQLVECPGDDCTYVKEGDYVYIEPHQMTPIKIEDDLFLLISEYKVLGKVLNYKPEPEQTKSNIIL